MSRTIKQHEGFPDAYPSICPPISGAALAATWQRIEHYIAWRFAPRTVVWLVESDGAEWHAPLAPVVSIAAQVGADEASVPEQGATGGWVLPSGIVTVTATVGAGPAPATACEAVRRLNAYLGVGALIMAEAILGGARGYNDAPLRWHDIPAGQALVNSGAADLLRAYRRV